MSSLFERVGRSSTRKESGINTSSSDSGGSAPKGFDELEPVSSSDVKGYKFETKLEFPTAKKALEALQSFLRSKPLSRTDPSRYDSAPRLSPHPPELSEGRDSIGEKFGILFDQEPDPTYTAKVLAATRLTTSETLDLVRKTASTITQRGLETPGIFRPFWYSHSPQEQRKLLILFLQTLSKDPTPTTNEAKPSNTLENFENELNRASPHDVAELFKWAIRHFRLESASFGSSSDEYGWYKSFAEGERMASFPPDAYSTILRPLLPLNHFELLNVIFNFVSSVASHAETNGVSGSKLTRSIGWWLLSERQQSGSGLAGFIQDWDTAARILEHLFLAYVRNQQRLGLMPQRLSHLVKSYPYFEQASPTDQYFLPRPKFTTQRRTALFVRVEVPSNAKDLYTGKPLKLLKDAIAASVDETSGNAEYHSIWEEVKRQATEAYPQSNSSTPPSEGTSIAPVVSVSRLLAEHAIVSMASAGGESAVTPPTKPADSVPESPPWHSISSTRKTDDGFSTTNGTALPSSADQHDFTGQGFGGISDPGSSALSPPPRQVSKVGGKLKKKQRSDAINRHVGPGREEFPSEDTPGIMSETIEGTMELDEAFIDNWAQIILDKTVASAWPSFVLYELRNSLTLPSSIEAERSPTQIQWLVIETHVKTTTVPPTSTTKGPSVEQSSSQKSERRRTFEFFASASSSVRKRRSSSQDSRLTLPFRSLASTISLIGKDGKEDNSQKRKDPTRRTRETNTDSSSVKTEEPSKSQVDVSTPPTTVAEEPEPTTPNLAIAEKAALGVQRAAEEKARLEPEGGERQRLAKEEEARLAAERARLEAEELEQKPIAKEAEEEVARKAAEAEAARIAKEQEEREASEAAEKAKLKAEHQERLAKEQAEREATEKARLQAEELERERLAEEEARLAAGSEAAGGFDTPHDRGPRKGKDLIHKVNVTLEDLYKGKTTKLALTKHVICSKCNGKGGKAGAVKQCGKCDGRGIKVTPRQIDPTLQQIQQTCNECDGTGEIINQKGRCKTCNGKKVVSEQNILELHIDKGMKNGETIIFAGESDQAPDVIPGDVVIVLEEKPHAAFKRKDNNLLVDVELGLLTALAGGQFAIKHLDNRALLVKLDPGEVMKNGTVKLIRGQGMPFRRHDDFGDLLVNMRVKFPDHIDPAIVPLLEQALPPRAPAATFPPEVVVDEVDIVDMDERQQQEYAKGTAKAKDEDEDEEPGVQCANQ